MFVDMVIQRDLKKGETINLTFNNVSMTGAVWGADHVSSQMRKPKTILPWKRVSPGFTVCQQQGGEQDGPSPSVKLEQDNHQYHVNPMKDEGGSVNQEDKRDKIDVTK